MIHVVLYEPEIAENTGNVGRTCVAAGAKLWLVRPLGFRLEDRRLRRAGMDYWTHLEWEAVDDWASLVARLPDRPFWYFTKNAARPYTEAQFGPDNVLVFGSESRGLPQKILTANPQTSVKIPIRPEARSLNLAVAVGIALFECIRAACPSSRSP